MGCMFSPMSFSGHCSHKIADGVLHKPYTLRQITGVMVRYCLGCGANGCAFRAGDGLVLKVSLHEGEAPIAEIVKGHDRAWPFLPIFHGAWVVPGGTLGRRQSVGITLREDLIDFSPDHPKAFMSEATNFLEEALRDGSVERVKALRRNLGSSLRELTTFDGQALRMLADFAVWSANYGLGFDLEEFSGSLSVANLGQSLADDAIVIRDLGNFTPTPGALDRMRRATQQRARERRREANP